jgi:phospho-N-acetylmuramoyl-pentapeptide-transferase
MLGCAAIGFSDDYLKLRRRHSLGLPGRWKMVLLLAVTVGAALLLQETEHFTTSIYVPVISWDVNLGFFFYPFLFLVIAGTVNGANLTDGIDGLAAGTATIMLLTFLAIAGIAWIRSGAPGDRSEVYLDIATLAAALIGGTIGFLWYNAFPAEVFMGDTGSMALGGAIAGFAIVTGTEILLPLIGGIFVIEVLSLIIQVVSFKRTGRRVFLMAPIHHHFEMKAWSETKVMVRFWIICAILCASGFALFYGDFLQFVEP